LIDPRLYFSKIPDGDTRCEQYATREVVALLEFVDRCVSKRDDLPKLALPDKPSCRSVSSLHLSCVGVRGFESRIFHDGAFGFRMRCAIQIKPNDIMAR